MNDTRKKKAIYSKTDLDDIFQILEYSTFSVLDIRHSFISPAETPIDYLLPSSTFFFINADKASIILDDISYHINQFSLLHGIKDTKLSIIPHCEQLEYYLVSYENTESKDYNSEKLQKLLKRVNPYHTQYEFTPRNPVLITDLLRNMFEQKQQATPIKKFYIKTKFYQLLYEIYQELASAYTFDFNSDIVGMTIRYMEENYATRISVQDICRKIGISYSQFYRIFKRETGNSFQTHLMKIRLDKAREYIIESDYPLSEIAKFTGFYDEFHLSSSFKKSIGISPVAFRKNLTWNKKYTYMEIPDSLYYNKIRQVSYGEPTLEGVDYMLNHLKNKASVAAVVLSLMTLFTACSAQSSNSDNSASTQVQTGTRIVSTVKGDVEVPLNPKRIVTDSGLLGDILALGVNPVAIEDYGSKDVAYKDLIKNTKVLEKWEPEFIMAESPDLIVTLFEENYDQLSKIAPTVYVPDSSMTTEERLTFIAQTLGKEPEDGKKIVADFYKKADSYKTKLKEAGFYNKTFSVIRVQGENKIGVRWSNNLGGQILFGALGLPMTESALQEINGGVDWGKTLSFEALPQYMGDYILVTESNNYNLIENNPVWKSLPAVQAGNILRFSEPYMYQNDIYSWSAQLDLIANTLLKSVK